MLYLRLAVYLIPALVSAAMSWSATKAYYQHKISVQNGVQNEAIRQASYRIIEVEEESAAAGLRASEQLQKAVRSRAVEHDRLSGVVAALRLCPGEGDNGSVPKVTGSSSKCDPVARARAFSRELTDFSARMASQADANTDQLNACISYVKGIHKAQEKK